LSGLYTSDEMDQAAVETPNAQAAAIHGSPTMRQDPDVQDGMENFVAQQKVHLTNCETQEDVQTWVELREGELKKLKKHSLPMWNDLRAFKETRITEIISESAKP
jgi:hypothetical protein